MHPFCVPCKAQARQSLVGCGQSAPHNIQAPAPKMALRSVAPRSNIDRGRDPLWPVPGDTAPAGPKAAAL